MIEIFISGVINKLIIIINIKNKILILGDKSFLSSKNPIKNKDKIDNTKIILEAFDVKPKISFKDDDLNIIIYIRQILIFSKKINPPSKEIFFEWIFLLLGESKILINLSIELKKNKKIKFIKIKKK